jgi:FKBP-type peptidyl-prolyl cis-trans isomerase
MSILRRFTVLAIVLLVLGACGEDQAAPADDGESSAASGDCEEGTVTTDSGLEYEEIECGDGEEAGRGDTVSVKYRGTLEDGKEFDADTYPFQIGSGMVIPGWEEGIPGMKVGGKRKLIIPPDLAYGAQGSPPVIPPNATLIFDVELLEIQQPQ